MKKEKIYYSTRFSIAVINEGYELFLKKINIKKSNGIPDDLSISINDVNWSFDTLEEWYSEYTKADRFRFIHIVKDSHIILSSYGYNNVSLNIKLPSRPQIEAIFQIFEQHIDESKIITSNDPITVFIGHGHSNQWRDLKDHLTDYHGIKVTAYEVGPRAGLSVKEVLESMLDESSIALLILTGEDIHSDGEIHARENVIHEVGLFQGNLGFKKAIVLLEEEVKEFSNILGINQIRFSKGNIRETFGDVIALIKREFENEID